MDFNPLVRKQKVHQITFLFVYYFSNLPLNLMQALFVDPGWVLTDGVLNFKSPKIRTSSNTKSDKK